MSTCPREKHPSSAALLCISSFFHVKVFVFLSFSPQMFAAAGRKNRVCSCRERETHFAGNWFLRTCAIQIKSDSIDWYSGMCAWHSGSIEGNGTLIYRAVPHLRACEKVFNSFSSMSLDDDQRKLLSSNAFCKYLSAPPPPPPVSRRALDTVTNWRSFFVITSLLVVEM